MNCHCSLAVFSETSKIQRGMEQTVARWTHNPKAAGSSPASATKI